MTAPSNRPLLPRLVAAAAPTALVLALTGCSAVTSTVASYVPVPSSSLVPPEQAMRALDTLLDDSLSQVQPRLQYWDAWPSSTEQGGGIDDHSLGYAVAARDRHITTKVAPAKYATLLGMVEQGWKAKGYTVATPAGSILPSLAARSPDGYSVTITIYTYGNINISASGGRIPVIRDHDPFGTPTPVPVTTNGDPDILPKHDDPFWSV
ncbi:hypothetical protein [Streptomyces sp. FH025]|uniref:hypothetical protein n=1 Tax=Streptomyces sp. FH025 TaxID=2815937 RepID=UPI001A9F060F|nr:hypothetical protein [Streptomyces sp. FH025]MBO1415161.1 hypothetical protein [Streptomyces sp. FH025]